MVKDDSKRHQTLFLGIGAAAIGLVVVVVAFLIATKGFETSVPAILGGSAFVYAVVIRWLKQKE